MAAGGHQPQVIAGGILEDPQAEFRDNGQQVIKDIGLDCFIQYPSLFGAEYINFNGQALGSGGQLADHEGQILVDIKNLIDSMNLQDRVFLTGFREDISAIIKQLEIFVLPSISEGLSIATIEAMALGKPVIVTDSGGPKEIVENEKTGLIVPPKDSRAIAESVIRLISDKAYASTLGMNGKAAVRKKFGINENIDRYVDLYRNCLHHNNGIPSRY